MKTAKRHRLWFVLTHLVFDLILFLIPYFCASLFNQYHHEYRERLQKIQTGIFSEVRTMKDGCSRAPSWFQRSLNTSSYHRSVVSASHSAVRDTTFPSFLHSLPSLYPLWLHCSLVYTVDTVIFYAHFMHTLKFDVCYIGLACWLDWQVSEQATDCTKSHLY